jgi:hypothetical protein
MMSSNPLILLLPLLALLSAGVRAEEPVATAPAAAPDTATAPVEAPAAKGPDAEQLLAIALREQLRRGEAITLQVTGKEVLALFQQQTRGQALGGVLILHDLNGHPDWPGVTRALRQQLPDAGWHTLSLQLPHADSAQATLEQLDAIRPRIAAALTELEKRGVLNTVIIGHGQGALAAIDYLNNNIVPAVRGLVVISLDGTQNPEERLDGATGLARINLPILDIYAEHDNLKVLESAKRRYDLARRTNTGGNQQRTSYADIAPDYNPKLGLTLSYRQVSLSGADHHFTVQGDALVKRLRGWLEHYAAGTELKAKN